MTQHDQEFWCEMNSALRPVRTALEEISFTLEKATGPLLREALLAIAAPAAGGKPVIRCMNCAKCFDLDDADPRPEYSGTGDGSFYCAGWDMEFYAPEYTAETFYCGDAVERETTAAAGTSSVTADAVPPSP